MAARHHAADQTCWWARRCRFAAALVVAVSLVEAALEALERHPALGRRRFKTYPDLADTRSWAIGKPFHRFIIFCRIEKQALYAERLLEGHSRLAGGQ